ncbi:DUF839 domain-containing protein [Temperatibacter marinus]|uniref:DUF839 domain-containing protein n=1 Tax=Temperatibacter marinus TaxID=1456591 RepID=A0AA52EF46_9PROT|nr:alkaline phosphatase PhoX [Temperatibacter marinus]WND01399.1 DUF839 domain-containing protein [Temperatibacter marinus]
MKMNRRHFSMLLTSVAFAGFAAQQGLAVEQSAVGYGALKKDPNGLLDLPEGFSYTVISELGSTMSDGHKVPDRADGMGCIPLSETKVALVRNHELSVPHPVDGDPEKLAELTTQAFDTFKTGAPLGGGTTTLIYDMTTERVEREFISLIGTIRNCSGGITPWGSWLTCEENTSVAGDMIKKDHGWVFEVPATATGPVDPVPLKGLGRFNHEAAAVDPDTGIVYLTEDRNDSLFYRFIPKTKGKLSEGGQLQAMVYKDKDQKADSRNWGFFGRTWKQGDWLDAEWINLEDVESPKDDLREQGHKQGGVLFARGEGIHWGDGELYFCCTSGGSEKLGQIIRYVPGTASAGQKSADVGGRVQLFVESNDPKKFNYGDNLTVAPNGHLFVCEDQYTDTVRNSIVGVTKDGALYQFGRILLQTEPAGACFSPDGSTMFVNLYSPTRTLAIKGPWDSVKA